MEKWTGKAPPTFPQPLRLRRDELLGWDHGFGWIDPNGGG